MSNSLLRQLELARFDRALEIAESLAEHRALLTTAELARINGVLTGRGTDPAHDPWRQDTVSLELPSGKKETLSMIADPKQLAREKLHRATELAEQGQALDGVVVLYSGLVLAHVFEDANRRTAALAAHYFFKRYGIGLTGLLLHELGLGDLRDPAQLELLRETLRTMAKFAERRGG